MKTFLGVLLGVTLGVLLGGVALVWTVEKCPWLQPTFLMCPCLDKPCNCNKNCTCGADCTCTPDNKCSDGCTCNKGKKEEPQSK